MTIINCFRMYDIYFVINEMRKERVMNEGNNKNNFASDIKNFMTRINDIHCDICYINSDVTCI